MNDTGAAIVGTGFMGPVHAEALRRLGIPVVGILGSTPEKSRRAAAALGIGKAYATLDELLADERVDSVHITTPNRLHYPQTCAALRAGKHVLCEKPLAMTAAESAELVELADAGGKVAGVNYNIRFYPLCLQAAQIVRRGDLGEILAVRGSYVQDWLLYPTDYNWRVLAEEGGALRAVADIGTHWLDLVQQIAGRQIRAVCADLHTVHPVRQRPQGEVETFQGKLEQQQATEAIDIATEDCGSVMLRFDNGARGCLWVSQVTAGRKNRLEFEISGSRSALAWCSERPEELWCGYRDRANESLMRDPGLLAEPVRHFTDYPGGHCEGFPDSFKQCFRAFYDHIADRTGQPRFPTFADGHREILLCEAILESHRQSRWIELEGDRP